MNTAPNREPTDLNAICRAVAEGKKIDPAEVKRVVGKSHALRRKIDGPSSVDVLRSIRGE